MTMTLFEPELAEAERTRLEELEAKIDAGLQTFVDVGLALLEIRDKKLYRRWHGTFEEYCGERWGFTAVRAKQLMDSAVIAKNLETIVSRPIAESHLRPLKNLQPDKQRVIYQDAINTAPNGKVTAAHVEATARRFVPPVAPDEDEQFLDDLAGETEGYEWTEQAPTARPHVTHNSGNNEWYTPAEYIEAARKVLGEIDLDPASSLKANEIVQAKYLLTAEDNGLEHPWYGRVWMNPPYGSEIIQKFTNKFALHVRNGDIEEGIVLVNNATETVWFNQLVEVANAIVFPRGRIRYWRAEDEKTNSPLQGQAILYAGPKPSVFLDTFRDFGWGAIF